LLVAIIVISGFRRVGTSARQRRSTPAPEHLSTGAQPWWLLAAYGLAYLPFFGVSRVLFLYHYFTPLMFAVAFVLLWLEQAGWTRTDGVHRQHASYYAVMAAAVVGFVLMSPLTYGFTAGAYSNWLVAVIRSWR
jgi:dolichyl-phosphate-mannose--protein O-mannosyl transferase